MLLFLARIALRFQYFNPIDLFSLAMQSLMADMKEWEQKDRASLLDQGQVINDKSSRTSHQGQVIKDRSSKKPFIRLVIKDKVQKPPYYEKLQELRRKVANREVTCEYRSKDQGPWWSTSASELGIKLYE